MSMFRGTHQWSSDEYGGLSPDTAANVFLKVDDYGKKLKLVVYGDNDPVSIQMWKSIFREDLDTCYSTNFGPTPIPPDEPYEQFEERLRKYVTLCVADVNKNLVWGLYNLAAPGHKPRLHLVLVNRKLTRSELGRWAQTTRPTRRSSFVSPQQFSELKRKWQARSREGSGVVMSPLTRSGSRLRELSVADLGESSGTVSSSVKISPSRRLFSESTHGGPNSAEMSGLRSVERRLSGSSSASLSLENDGSHQDPRFISIESLRDLVENLLMHFFDTRIVPDLSPST